MSNTTESHPINKKALYCALFELLELNWFIADTSRLLQLDDVMEDERVVTSGYRSQLAAAIEKASNKVTDLHEIVQKAIGVQLRVSEHKYNIGLFDMPSDTYLFPSNHERKVSSENTA